MSVCAYMLMHARIIVTYMHASICMHACLQVSAIIYK
jgi:hypothetical protein